MPILRIEGGRQVKPGNQGAQYLATAVLSQYLGPLAAPFSQVLFGATELKPPPGFELDTDTGRVAIDGGGTPVMAALLEEVWKGDLDPANLGRRWRPAGRLLAGEGRAYRAQPQTIPADTGSAPDMASAIIPPGGFAGFSQMTPASRAALQGGSIARSPKRRKKRRAARATAKRAKRATRKASGRKKLKRLVKGSAAAKRYMAALRRKRRR